MPTYVYRRTSGPQAGTTFELRQSINDAPIERCPDTDAPVRRVVQAASVRFNGGGYYASDYGGKNASA